MKRPNQHVSGDNAINILKLALPEPWIKRDVSHDYGVDMEIEIVDGENVTGQRLWLQVKGVNQLKVIQSVPYSAGNPHRPDAKTKPCIAYSMEIKHLRYALLCDISYLLVIVDLKTEACYWLPIRDEVEILLPTRNPMWDQQQSATVYLPLENKIERRAKTNYAELRWYSREPSRIRSFWELQKNKTLYEMECQMIETIRQTGVPSDLDRMALLREVGRALTRLNMSISIWQELHNDGMTFMSDSTIQNLTVAAKSCLELLRCNKDIDTCKTKCIRSYCSHIAFAMNSSVKIDASYDMFRRMFLHTTDRVLHNYDTSRKNVE
ncbi:DUF4365 domain-containing protein [Mariniblastus sp.]|nr:DUF4365 domain-containing protein [Mariniblastus sp.]